MTLGVKYKTGVVWQDFQHKQLINLFEKIKEAKASQKDQNLYRYTLAFLSMYVTDHFKLEEEYMEKYEYPNKEEHMAEHKGFIHDLKTFKTDHGEYTEDGSEDLMLSMGDWILNHILGDDKILGTFIMEEEKKQARTDNQ